MSEFIKWNVTEAAHRLQNSSAKTASEHHFNGTCQSFLEVSKDKTKACEICINFCELRS